MEIETPTPVLVQPIGDIAGWGNDVLVSTTRSFAQI